MNFLIFFYFIGFVKFLQSVRNKIDSSVRNCFDHKGIEELNDSMLFIILLSRELIFIKFFNFLYKVFKVFFMNIISIILNNSTFGQIIERKVGGVDGESIKHLIN